MLHDVAHFLAGHPPFAGLTEAELDAVAAAAEIEFHPAGEVILAQGAAPVGHVWVVRTGAVELLDGGRVLDLLGEGEMFGHPSMLSGLPVGFEVRAAEDTLCYRLGAAVVAPLLEGREGVRFVARTLLQRSEAASLERARAADPGHRPVAQLVRPGAVVVEPTTTIRRAARRMTRARATSVVVALGDGRLGIVTDRDLRSRVATGEVGVEAPVSAVMTPDAFVAAPERLGSEVLVEMLDRGVRHVPVVDARGAVVGVLDDFDLLASESRAPFHLRRAIRDAPDVETLAAIGGQVGPAVVALHDSGLTPDRVSAILAAVVDAATRRLLDLAVQDLGPAPVPVSWLAAGSFGRGEPMPSSDADTALAWHGDDADPELRRWTAALAGRVMDGLARWGLTADEHGVRADRLLFARSADAWRAAIADWAARPEQEKALIAVSVMLDGRVVWGADAGRSLLATLAGETLGGEPQRRGLVGLLARLALTHRPPTGFLRGLVVEHSGEHRGTLDLKRGGVLPIADLARWAGLAAGSTATGTPARLRDAAAAGTLSEREARTLEEAWDLVVFLRLDHQVEQLRAGRRPDDHLDPQALNPLMRRYLRETFRAVASIQRGIGTALQFGTGA